MKDLKMYTKINYKTKKEMKEAVKAGKEVEVYEPGNRPCKNSGEVALEGPHAPESHTWYARVIIKNRIIVEVLH